LGRDGAEAAGQLVAIPEEPDPNASHRFGLEVNQDVDVAAGRVEIVAQNGAECAQPDDATVTAERCPAVTIQCGRQLLGSPLFLSAFCDEVLSIVCSPCYSSFHDRSSTHVSPACQMV